jgi:hypothetical protein
MRINIFLGFLVFLFCNGILQAQCTANAGATYQYACPGFNFTDTLVLGGQPSASGGVAPYTYSWYIKPFEWLAGRPPLYASSILDDTTAANPKVLGHLADTLKVYLTITDAQNCRSIDSCRVVYSLFGQTLGTRGYSISRGDTLALTGSNLMGFIEPVSYVWRPNRGLIDSTGLNILAQPDSSVSYFPVATDATGCTQQGAPYHFVTVNTLSSKEQVLAPQLSLYPNPAQGWVRLVNTGQRLPLSLVLYNSQGQRVRTFSPEAKTLNLRGLAAGSYWLQIQSEQGQSSHRLVKLR